MPLRAPALAPLILSAVAAAFFLQPAAIAQTQLTQGFEPRCFALTGARVVLSPETELPAATVVLRDGLIVAAGADVMPPPDAEIIDISGHVIYPGFVDAASSALLDPKRVPLPTEGRAIDFTRFALAATPSDNRRGLTPEFAAQNALKNDPSLWEARRRAGITTTHVVPVGRIASGQSALVSSSGLPLRESVIAAGLFPQFQLFALLQDGYPATLMGTTAHLRQTLLDARRHLRQVELYRESVPGVERPLEDPVLISLGSTLANRHPALFLAQSRDDIHRALDFAAEQEVPPLIVGAREGWRAADRLKNSATGVIALVAWGDSPKVEVEPAGEKLQPQVKDPRRVQQHRVDRWKEQVSNLKALHAAGIRFALGTEGLSEPALLWKSLRQAIEAGLPRTAALSAITRDAAALLGQESRLGTIAPGKLAHLVVLTGSFDDARSKTRFVFVDGIKFEYNKDEKPVPPLTTPPPPAAALAGLWNLEIDAGDAKLFGSVEFVQNDSVLSGMFRSSQGEGRISTGKVEGRRFEFTVSIGAGAQAIELKFQGEVAEQQPASAAGTLKSAFGAATKFTAQRKESDSTSGGEGGPRISLDDGAAAPPANESDGELPSEIESDRLQRHLATGGNVLITNGTVLTGWGAPLPRTSLLVRQGKIAAIGPDLVPDAGMTVIDAAGRYVAAGIIDTHSHIMFAEGMGGVNEATASLVPEVRVRDVVRSEDPGSYRALAGGVTAARLLHGSANVVGGQDAVVKMKFGELAREQLLHGNPQGVKFALGENVKRQRGRFPNTRLGVEATLNRAFLEAIDYRRQWQEYNRAVAEKQAAGQPVRLLPPRRDLRLEALADIVEQQKFIHSHCYRADETLMLLRVASGLGVRVWSLQHVLEGYKIAPEIAAHGASCSTFADWWAYKVEAFDATPYNAALLHEAGANVVLKSDDAELMRHLNIDAAKMLRYGDVAPDAAWRMVTLNAARELGLAERMGSVEVGKDADLVIFNGHPLNSCSRCEMTLVEGVPYFVREKQPSAMSSQAAKASSAAPVWSLPSAEIRQKKLDLSVIAAQTYAIAGATIHPVDGPEIAPGTLLVHGNRIAAVGGAVDIPAGAPVLDATGLHIYPGLIDAGSILGLQEIGSLRETHDYNEPGLFQPDLRAGVGVNPDSELIPVGRAGGITASLVRPAGALMGGQASLIQLDGWTVPEMVLDYEVALQIEWPDGGDGQAVSDQIAAFFQQARTYQRVREQSTSTGSPPPIQDPRFEALLPYLNRRKKVHVEANSRKAIAEALLFAERENLSIVITGGAEAWKLAAELTKRQVPVVVGAVMSRPYAEYDPFDAQYANPGRLHEAGVLFCIRSNATSTAGFNASNVRNAPFDAALAVAYGLPESEALRSVTINAAKILGVDQQMGTLAAGKLANFVITDGSPLQPSTLYKGIVIGGKPHPAESRHTRFYDRYRARLHEVQSRK